MSDIKRLLLLTMYNVKLQFRHGFYFAWIFITIFYLAVFYFLPERITNTILPLILLSEPSTFAMIFTGAIVLLERDDKMLENLFITPLSIKTYIHAKMISIAIPATLCTMVISIATSNFTLRLFLIIPAVILTTFFFVIYTLIFSTSSKDIIGMVGKIGLYGSIFVLSIADYFGYFTGYFQYILPSKGALVLISTALSQRDFSIPEILLSLTTMVIAVTLVMIPAEKAFYKQIILKGGE